MHQIQPIFPLAVSWNSNSKLVFELSRTGSTNGMVVGAFSYARLAFRYSMNNPKHKPLWILVCGQPPILPRQSLGWAGVPACRRCWGWFPGSERISRPALPDRSGTQPTSPSWTLVRNTYWLQPIRPGELQIFCVANKRLKIFSQGLVTSNVFVTLVSY